MAKEAGIRTPSICLLCLLCFAGWTVFAAEGKQVRSLLVNTAADSPPNTESSQKIGGPQHDSRGRKVQPPVVPQQANSTTWCIVKPSTPQEKLDEIIGYCCTQKGVDCGVIQPGGICYFPPNKVSDASVVMDIYYKVYGKNGTNCNFSGSGLVVNQDPSVGTCIYPA